jgi:hypothetical protein
VTSTDGRVIFSDGFGAQTMNFDGSGLTTVGMSFGIEETVEGNIGSDGSTIAPQLCDTEMTGPQPGCILDSGSSQLDTSIYESSFSWCCAFQ